jgi:predicted O-methyltransferase YrrM
MTVYKESAWTAARPWCPFPERWSSTDPQSTELEVSDLVGGFIRGLQPTYVVETGTCIGQTAEVIGSVLSMNGQGMLDTIEVNAEYAAVAKDRCRGLPVRVYEMRSLEFEPIAPIDFLWLDSLFEIRLQEFERFRPWLHAGSIIGIHDTAPHHGVMGAAAGEIPGTRSIRLHTPRGVTFLQLDLDNAPYRPGGEGR